MERYRSKTPDFHKEILIQPIITQAIVPVITTEIQPVIFKENQTNIEEVIQKLEKSNNQNPSNIIEKHSEMFIPQPRTLRESKTVKQKVIQPYIMREEKHITQKKVEEKIETKIPIAR